MNEDASSQDSEDDHDDAQSSISLKNQYSSSRDLKEDMTYLMMSI